VIASAVVFGYGQGLWNFVEVVCSHVKDEIEYREGEIVPEL